MSRSKTVYIATGGGPVVYHEERGCATLRNATNVVPRQLAEVEDERRACDRCRYAHVPTLSD